MATGIAYLDHNASAPVRPEAAEAVREALGVAGNPSSIHAAGRAARALVERARAEVAALVGAQPEDVTFTSGGSEANALALSPCGDGHLLVGASEHPSVLAGGRFAADRIEAVPVDGDGLVDLGWIESRLSRGPGVAMVSVMAANNETGTIQPVARIAELARKAGATFHCDAVQLAGRMPFDLAGSGADLVTLSAHKLGGPQGVGALIRRRGSDLTVEPLIRGGGQERSLRAGTENVAGIAGFGAAAAACHRDLPHGGEIVRLRDWLEQGVRSISPDITVFGAEADRLPNTSCFAVPGMTAEKAVIALDLEGVAVSSGSACSSGKVAPSHVLAAMGVEHHLSSGAIRVSLGWSSTSGDVERFLEAWRRVTGRLGRKASERAA